MAKGYTRAEGNMAKGYTRAEGNMAKGYTKAEGNMAKGYTRAEGKLVPARKSKPLKNCRLGCKKILGMSYGDDGKTYKDHDKRVAYVCGLVDTASPKTKRTRTDNPGKQKYRLVTHTFHFNVYGKRIRVCKDSFVKTLGETHSFVNLSLCNRNDTVSDNRGREASANKHSEGKMALVRDCINSIPKWESGKYYLPAHLNLTLLYEKYLESTDDPFHQLNISFKEPHLETGYTCGILNTTIKRQNLAKTNSVNTRCYMFELKQCLPTPCVTGSVVFYKLQLWTFNLRMYDSTNSRTRCYVWHEAEDARDCDFHLQGIGVEHVILYSGTCGGQNKNPHVSAMFLTAMQNNQHLKTVDHKCMASGHSHFECDINHARIEVQKKRLEIQIYGPHDWYQSVRSTGPKNNKYQVIKLSHHDFFEEKDNDRNVFSWHQTKWFRYTKEYGQILFKNTLSDDEPFNELSLVRSDAAMTTLEPKKCYTEQLPIPEKNKNDLISILDLHHFYLELKSSLKIPDVLPDIEKFTNEH
ncbi:hypothetical protein PR048_018843 [Dryococelus australis]|uniref:Uncharacterized protein n=1 Tax=Dryococelus australis TaxID=614101 RepID=A0ABQ9H1T5_9NEOP|nr:hypothetical protein PR048_018843 [Dryococelus australis]